MDLRADYEGRAALRAFSPGVPYEIDASKLTFTARRYGRPDDAARPADIALGEPVFVPPIAGSSPNGQAREYAIPARFGAAPDGPGMYDVMLRVAEGFARTKDGVPLRFSDWGHPKWRWHVLVYWPDERNGDGQLAQLRKRLAGTSVYGYGSISIECHHPVFLNTYDAHVGVHVRDVLRDTGTVQHLWMGVGSGSLDSAPNFFAVDPLRIVVDVPDAKSTGTAGTTIGPTRSARRSRSPIGRSIWR
jgi:hypothetical protein